jgi:excisionase family DNA binding protein
MAEEKYLTLEQVAQHYQVSLSTVRSWVRMGAIPADKYIKVGKTFRFKISEVDAALRALNQAKQSKLMDIPEATPDQDM